MGLGALLLRDQQVGRFLDPVVKEAIGILGAKNEARANCLSELIMYFIF